MASSRTISKRAKEIIYRIMDERGEMTREEIIGVIRPHFNYDVDSELELALGREANKIMAKAKDKEGIRKYLNCRLDGVSLYIDIEKTTNVEALLVMENQNSKVITARSKSNQKIRNRRWEIEGQMSLDLADRESKGE